MTVLRTMQTSLRRSHRGSEWCVPENTGFTSNLLLTSSACAWHWACSSPRQIIQPTCIGTNFDFLWEQYYEKLKTAPFSGTRNLPAHESCCYDLWDADGGDSSQASFDDTENHSVHHRHETSTQGGAPPSPTIIGPHAQRFRQKDEARSKGQITFKAELLSGTVFPDSNLCRD